MRQVSFLLADGVLKPSSLFSAIEVFEKANEFYRDQGKGPYYDIQIVGSDLSQHLLNTSFMITEIKNIARLKKTDCIIITGFDGNDEFAIQKSSKCIAG